MNLQAILGVICFPLLFIGAIVGLIGMGPFSRQDEINDAKRKYGEKKGR